MLTHALAVRAWAAIMTSDFGTALTAAEEAGRLAAETAQPLWEAGSWTAQAALAALRGDQPAVCRLTARVEEVMLPVGTTKHLSLVQYARGLLALGQGRHADAYDQLHRIYQPGDPACDPRNQLAAVGDLAEAAYLAFRLARTLDQPGDEGERLLGRILTPVAKYWNCKRAPLVAGEAIECIGGNGYVEEHPLPRYYREAPRT